MIWTALDVGTTKICAIISQTNKQGEIEILGIGKAPSHGLARGVVVDAKKTVTAIKEAITAAERMAGKASPEAVYVGISGSHISSYNSQGVIALKGKEIRQHDITAVVNAAKAIPLTEGHQVLHAIPQYFIIDGNHIVQNPLNMHGIRLEAAVHIIAGEVTSVQNLISCCEMADLKVKDIILEPLASAEATLTSDEKELGVAMLDIGGGTADFAVYHQGTIRHTKIFPIAGNMFTSDLAICLKTTRDEAERLKKEYGYAHDMFVDHVIPLAIRSLDHQSTHTISSIDVAAILGARTQELFELISQEIKTYNLAPYIAGGMVITGGGGLLRNLDDYATTMLNIPVRIGTPHIEHMDLKKELENASYATSYGLVLYPHIQRTQALVTIQGPAMSRVLNRMKAWVYDLF
ncbi:MAG: Cell division protein ftsA [candidate division TM6 bacterium GW2011_GWE2_41_16]|nr:MAG: Cell division protein ftsA [candidate division TM6 bacterium GW2011_GWE2_41_16]